MRNIVTHVCSKSNCDQLRIDKALGFRRSDNNKKKNKHKNQSTKFIAIWTPSGSEDWQRWCPGDVVRHVIPQMRRCDMKSWLSPNSTIPTSPWRPRQTRGSFGEVSGIWTKGDVTCLSRTCRRLHGEVGIVEFRLYRPLRVEMRGFEGRMIDLPYKRIWPSLYK